VPIITNINALGNSLLQKPLAGALSRVATQSMGLYASQPLLTQMAQEERLRQDQDGLTNVMNSRKKKLKDKAAQSPMVNMQSAMPGAMNVSKIPGQQTLGSIYG
jgi:hypothetical protein